MISIQNKEILTLTRTAGFMALFAFTVLAFVSTFWLIGHLLTLVLFGVSTGTEIDYEHERLRNYTKLFYYKYGLWQALSAYSAIVILSKSGTKESMGIVASSTYEVRHQKFYEIHLMNSSHLKRFFVHASKDKAEIKAILDQLINNTDLKYEKFNPVRLNKRR